MHQKLVLDPFNPNNPKQPLHARHSFKNKIFWKTIFEKDLKRLILFFLSKQVLFNWPDYEKQKGPGTSDQSLLRLQIKLRKISLLVILPDQVWWCNIKRFFSYSKNYISANLCKSIHNIINYSTFICPFESGKWGKGKKLQKFEYLENEQNFLDETKSIFHSF